ncbi:lamin tail domain-containing protein [Candidatus Falkowbacteria bacterium]|nr:lamin tail domain-containing protein [Candidatus Falkowbacteria bacterium]
MRQKGGFFYWVKIITILAVIGAGFFLSQKVLAEQNILINEIMYDLKGADDKHEWIEIYNPGSEAVDLTGWKFNDGDGATNHALNPSPENGSRGSMVIPAGGFILLAGNAETLIIDLPNYNGTIIDTVMSLSNTSAQLKLLNAQGIEIAAVSYDKNSGANGNGKTLEWDNNVFKESLAEAGTPGEVNGAATPPETPPETPPAQNDTASSTGENATPENTPNPASPVGKPLYQGGDKINFGDAVINEFVSDPADNEVEWIELYNKTNREIDLTGWRLEEGGKAKTNLSGVLGVSGSGRYKIIEKPAGNLNNAGDIIILYDSSGKIIDQIAYGDWNGGYLEDNAPTAPDPGSAARKFDGYNTYNNANDFAATLKPTKGGSNIIEVENEVSAEAKAKFDFASDIFISEILPNPAGDDAKLEFIEIYNAGRREVDLTGWSISREDDKKINLEKIATSTIIKAGEYLAFFRPRTKIVLHNDQGQIKLFQPLADKPVIIVDYKNVKEGWSYNMENYLTPLNPPLSGGSWVWSETITPGAMNVFKVANHPPEAEFNFKSPALINAPVRFDSSDTNDQDGDKLIYVWDFGDGFKNNLVNPEHTYLKAGIYKVKLAVNDGQATSTKEKSVKVVNSVDEMADVLDSRLPTGQAGLRGNDEMEGVFRNDKIIINEIFPNPEGADNGNWFWTTKATPGKENIISLAGSKSEVITKASMAVGAAGGYIETTLEKIKELDIGSLVKVKGTVAVEPGILGAQIFYIVGLPTGQAGSPGMQIYNYKKDFPVLKIGDYIEVIGELTEAQEELRIKTKDKNDIKIAERKLPPLALAAKGDEISEENIGQLITITGEITDKKSSSLYVDDGSDEIFIYIKQNTGITTKNLEPGQLVSATGILSRTQAGLRLLPRCQEDIVLINSAVELEPQVLGETALAGEWDVAERDKKLELFKYLLIMAGSVIIILAGLFIKAKRKN